MCNPVKWNLSVQSTWNLPQIDELHLLYYVSQIVNSNKIVTHFMNSDNNELCCIKYAYNLLKHVFFIIFLVKTDRPF